MGDVWLCARGGRRRGDARLSLFPPSIPTLRKSCAADVCTICTLGSYLMRRKFPGQTAEASRHASPTVSACWLNGWLGCQPCFGLCFARNLCWSLIWPLSTRVKLPRSPAPLYPHFQIIQSQNLLYSRPGSCNTRHAGESAAPQSHTKAPSSVVACAVCVPVSLFPHARVIISSQRRTSSWRKRASPGFCARIAR